MTTNFHYLHPFWFALGHTKIVVFHPRFGCDIHLVCVKGGNTSIKLVFLRHCPCERSYLIQPTLRKKIVSMSQCPLTGVGFIIAQTILLTQIQSPLDKPIGIIHRLRRPFGTWVVSECSLFCLVGSAVLFGKRPIIMIPGRSNNAKHLATLKRHLDNVFVRKADSTFGREWICDKNIHWIKFIM